MTQPHDPIDQPGLNGDREPGEVAPSGPAAAIVGILDRYLADLQAGEAPDRDHLLADHPDLAAQLEAPVAKEVSALALQRGLLVNPVRPDAIRVAPPLLVSDEELDAALRILGDALAVVSSGNAD